MKYRLIVLFSTLQLVSCATQQVSYQRDIAPVLQSECVACHKAPDGSGYRATGLQLDSHQGLMQGTVYGPVIVAGDSRRSILNMLVEGRAGKLQQMPHMERDGLSEEQIKMLSDWVNQGAPDN
jgi:cytochrome c553